MDIGGISETVLETIYRPLAGRNLNLCGGSNGTCQRCRPGIAATAWRQEARPSTEYKVITTNQGAVHVTKIRPRQTTFGPEFWEATPS